MCSKLLVLVSSLVNCPLNPYSPYGRIAAQSLPRNFFDFGSQNGDLWCILGAIFCSSPKTLRGRKDTLAQVYFYFYWGAIAPSPPRIDATLHQQDNVICICQNVNIVPKYTAYNAWMNNNPNQVYNVEANQKWWQYATLLNTVTQQKCPECTFCHRTHSSWCLYQ